MRLWWLFGYGGPRDGGGFGVHGGGNWSVGTEYGVLRNSLYYWAKGPWLGTWLSKKEELGDALHKVDCLTGVTGLASLSCMYAGPAGWYCVLGWPPLRSSQELTA